MLRHRHAFTASLTGLLLMDSMTEAPVLDLPRLTAPRLYECTDCGQMQVLPALPPGARAVCLRCDAVLRHTRRDPLLLPFALNLSALVLFLLGATLTLMSISTAGQQRVAGLVSGPVELTVPEVVSACVFLKSKPTPLPVPVSRLWLRWCQCSTNSCRSMCYRLRQ